MTICNMKAIQREQNKKSFDVIQKNDVKLFYHHTFSNLTIFATRNNYFKSYIIFMLKITEIRKSAFWKRHYDVISGCSNTSKFTNN